MKAVTFRFADSQSSRSMDFAGGDGGGAHALRGAVVAVAAFWAAVEIAARTSPPDAVAKWIEQSLPAEKSDFTSARRWFGMALGGIFLAAFWSWGAQVRGLVGEHGLIPVSEQLDAMRKAGSGFWQAPSLSWLVAGDAVLVAQCWLGALAAVAMCSGFFPGACVMLCWALYLSLISVGESFGNFQWDALLLETAPLAALWLPWRARASHRPDSSGDNRPLAALVAFHPHDHRIGSRETHVGR